VAQTLCINTAGLKLRAFIPERLLSGVAGGIYAYLLSPTFTLMWFFDINISILIVLMALFWRGVVLDRTSHWCRASFGCQ